MTEKKVESVIVTKNGRPFEIVTERDLIRRYFRDTLLESLAARPLITDISSYCRPLIEKCSKVLIMSATILNPQAFCRSVGLTHDKEVKFIQVKSDFPLDNRPIYPLNIAYLNYNNLQSP